MVESGRMPPRFVPTLTTVVESPASAQSVDEPVRRVDNHTSDSAWPPLDRPSSEQASPPGMTLLPRAEVVRLEEQLLHRVLQRIDLSLEPRLTDAMSAAVQQQLDVLVPLLRRELEEVLRVLVSEALARELS